MRIRIQELRCTAQLSSGPDCSLVNFKYRLSLYQCATGSPLAGHFQAGRSCSSCSLEQNTAAEKLQAMQSHKALRAVPCNGLACLVLVQLLTFVLLALLVQASEPQAALHS